MALNVSEWLLLLDAGVIVAAAWAAIVIMGRNRERRQRAAPHPEQAE